MVKFTANVSVKLKAQVIGPTTTYSYDIVKDEWSVLPITDGNGQYQIKVYKNLQGTTYVTVLSLKLQIELSDPLSPFLRPNQYVNYVDAPKTLAAGANAVAGKTSLLAKVEAVYDYVMKTLSYDYQKANTVQSGYLPDLDVVLAAKKGICSDYSALMTAMLRSQRIPCKLVVGYFGTSSHAWISVWSNEVGWIDGVIYFDGKSWEFMDPTQADITGNSALKGNYTSKYVY